MLIAYRDGGFPLGAKAAAAALLIPVGLLLIAYLMLRSTVLGVRMAGIIWRGKLSSTKLLESAQRVRV